MSELRVLAASVLLAGGVAAAVSAAVLRYGPTIESSIAPGHGAGLESVGPVRIATVRLAELTADHAMQVARAGSTPGAAAAATRRWAVALETALARVAARHRAVLLPARAVAAGAPDVTGRRRGGDGAGDGCTRAGVEAMSARPIFRRARPGRLRRADVALASMAVLAALWLGAASRIHVNASWSDEAPGAMPPSRCLAPNPAIGDLVLFEPPDAAGSPIPYLKTVRGLPGARIEVDADRTVHVDGMPLGRAKTRALDGRPLVAVAGGVIPAGHYYLHADHRDSHDSRYAEIGLVPRGRILGRAVALPDLPWLGLKGPLVGPEDAGIEDGSGDTAPRLPAGAAP